MNEQQTTSTDRSQAYLRTPSRKDAPDGYRPPYQLVPEAFDHEHHTDQDKEAQGKHLDRRMPVDEVAYRATEDHHEHDRRFNPEEPAIAKRDSGIKK